MTLNFVRGRLAGATTEGRMAGGKWQSRGVGRENDGGQTGGSKHQSGHRSHPETVATQEDVRAEQDPPQ